MASELETKQGGVKSLALPGRSDRIILRVSADAKIYGVEVS